MRQRAIFVSYRREDTMGHAGRLMDGLTGEFGDDSVFMDIDSIGPGVNYERRIQEQLAGCRVALILIGDDWLETTDASGKRRLDHPKDWVRLEVAAVLEREDITIVPVLVEGATMPAAEDLPENLKGLALIQAIELSEQRWPYDFGRLCAATKETTGGGRWVLSRPLVPMLCAGVIVCLVLAILLITGAFSGTSSAPNAMHSCEGGISASSATSCGFARRVERAYRSQIGSGTGTVRAYSPTTKKTYTMSCTGTVPHICTGGIGASVTFR